jgi:hypothetical protein
MPYVNKKRPYKKEYDNYHGKPEQIKKRSERNSARASMVEKGKAKVGDGRDVDHIVPLSKGGTSSPSNLRIRPSRDNRSFSRNSDHTVKRNSPKPSKKTR